MKILVVGGGGREHAIIRKLKQSPKTKKIYCCPGNGGISADAVCVNINAMDLTGIVDFAKREEIDLVVVAPDDPLAAGLVDSLNEAGIMTFGPNKAAAQIEASKVFSKNLMKRFQIPTAAYETFENPKEALGYIKQKDKYPIVIKADGLALGKGVIIAEDYDEAKQGIHEIMEDKIFGTSGNSVVVEEYLTGPEVSVLAFVDGKTVVPMVSAMDHKRALDKDKGPNTGGMGTVAPNNFYTPEVAEQCMESIFMPTVRAMSEIGSPFKGCLFFGLMLTDNGPFVIEYNCRFGDPETQVVLELLESDLVEIMESVYQGNLKAEQVRFSNEKAACVVMASGGYPRAYNKGLPIYGLTAEGRLDGVSVYHAGTKLEDGQYLTNGGRVIGITAKGNTLEEAIKKAYAAVEQINFKDAFCRKDIGAKCMNEL